MSDISDNEWLMYGLSILSFIHIIAMVVIIPFGIQSKEIGIIILGCLGIYPLIVLLVNPFKTFRVLNRNCNYNSKESIYKMRIM